MMSFPEHLLQDTRHAVRGLIRTPGFALVVIITMALGIGANTAIFSVVDQLLLRPVPYPAGERVVRIYEFRTERSRRSDVNPGNWLDWQRQSQTLQSLAAWDPATATLSGPDGAERVESLLVSAEFFPVLGVRPLLGRTIDPEDDLPSAPPVVVLSYSTWQRRFGGDPAVIGRRLTIDGAITEVIGVMPPRFRFVVPGTEFWTAFRLDRGQPWRDTAGRFMSVVARLRADASIAQARAEMDSIAASLRIHRINTGMSVDVVPISDELVGDSEGPVLAIYGAVIVLLGITCLNVANLLLARAFSRRQDMTVRAALGAGRRAIARPLLLEAAVLAAAGGVLGVLVARWTMSALLRLAPPDVLPLAGIEVDGWLVLYALSATLVTGLAAGLIPVALLARRTAGGTLRTSGRGVTHAPRLRQALVVAQIALTVVLLVGAGLLIRTVSALNRRDTGFDRQGLLTMKVDLPRDRYDEAGRVRFFQEARQRLRQVPGVESTSAAFSLPVTGPQVGRTGVNVFGEPERPSVELQTAIVRIATPDYFRTLGTAVRGREFIDSDQAPGAALVFVVNEAFVAAFLPGRDPLGTSISVGMQRENPYAPIVGVVADISEGTLWDSGQPTVFYNHAQLPSPAMTVVVRTAPSQRVDRAVVEALSQIDRTVTVADVQGIEVELGASLARERLIAIVSIAFAVGGLVLASLGLYGLLAFIVSDQTREIGIRMALGAPLRTLLQGVVARGLRMVAAGAAVGIAAAALLLRAAGSLFYGVSPFDLPTHASVLVLLLLVSVTATLVPARRAATLDPVTALRRD
jgi:putative ABC transport system permease protein